MRITAFSTPVFSSRLLTRAVLYRDREGAAEHSSQKRFKWLKLMIVLLIIAACGVMMFAPSQNVKAQRVSAREGNSGDDNLSKQLASALSNAGFTGRIVETLDNRLG